MADIFRSAFNYISQTGKSGNDFVGQYVELGPVQLRVRRVIAEGKADALSIRQRLISFCSTRKIVSELPSTNFNWRLLISINERRTLLLIVFRRLRVCFRSPRHVNGKRICIKGNI